MIGKPSRRGAKRFVSGSVVTAVSLLMVGVALAAPANAVVTSLNANAAQPSYATNGTAVINFTYTGTPSTVGAGLAGGFLYTVANGPDVDNEPVADGRCTDNGDGTGSCSVPNGGTAGTDIVEVFDDGNGDGQVGGVVGDSAALAAVDFDAPTYDAMQLRCNDAANGGASSSDCTLPVGTEQTTVTVTAWRQGQPAANQDVTLSVDNGTIAPTITTGADGTATATLTTGTTADGDTATVTATGPDTTPDGNPLVRNVTFTFATPTAESLSLSPNSQTKVIDNSAAVTATVDDQFGQPLGGNRVAFAIADGDRNGGTAVSRTTNSSGQARFAYADNPDDPNVFQDSITATAAGNSAATDTSTVNWLTSLTPDAINVGEFGTINNPDGCDADNGATASLQVVSDSDYARVVCVHVVNDSGQSLAGETVTVNVDSGFVNDSQQQTPDTDTSSVQVTTDANGRGVAFIGSKVAGTQTVTVSDGQASGSATADYSPDAAAHLHLTPANTQILGGNSQVYVAHVTDQYNNAIAGENVTFTRTGPGSVSVDVDGTPVSGPSETASTDADGNATVTLETTSGQQNEGSGSLVAADGQLLSDSVDYSVIGPPRLTTVTLWVGANRIVGGNEAAASHALDQFGNPVAGVRLTYNVTGADSTTQTAVTDSTGVAVVDFNVWHAGDISVSVSGPGGTPSNSGTTTVGKLPVDTTLALSSPRKGTVVATATIDPRNHATVGQRVAFYQYVAGSNGRYAYKAQATVTSKGTATFTFTGLKSGSKLGYRARIGNDPDVDSPYSAGQVVTVK